MRLMIAFFLLLLVLASCSSTRYAVVEIRGQTITAELAVNAAQKSRGLMHREELCSSCGMLFVFEEEKRAGFWMKNTLIPLDMVFINSDLEVVDVLHAVPCEDEPCTSYVPKDEALYVLETNQDIFGNSVIGEKVKIEYE